MTTRKKKTVTTDRPWPRRVATATAVLACLVALPFAALADKKKPENKEKPYGLIFGTAYGPDDRPLYGVRITIHPDGKKHPSWELISDHRGEFAQRVPVAAADYLVTGQAEYAPAGPDGKPQLSKKKRLKGEAKVHIEGEVRQDVGLHLTE